jgi:predicted  nucleic acid-binding Zn-ribbon protein
MDSETGNQSETAQPRPGLRERIGQRAWVRSAADEGSTATDSSASQHDGRGHHGPRGDGDPSQPQRDDEELLTGDTATQVTDAVLAEYPDATVERVETDSDGVYEAHIVTADDERLTVELDEDFAITGTEGD